MKEPRSNRQQRGSLWRQSGAILGIIFSCRPGRLCCCCCCRRCRSQPALLCFRKSRSRWGRLGCWRRCRPDSCWLDPGEWSCRGLWASPCQRSHPKNKKKGTTVSFKKCLKRVARLLCLSAPSHPGRTRAPVHGASSALEWPEEPSEK